MIKLRGKKEIFFPAYFNCTAFMQFRYAFMVSWQHTECWGAAFSDKLALLMILDWVLEGVYFQLLCSVAPLLYLKILRERFFFSSKNFILKRSIWYLAFCDKHSDYWLTLLLFCCLFVCFWKACSYWYKQNKKHLDSTKGTFEIINLSSQVFWNIIFCQK